MPIVLIIFFWMLLTPVPCQASSPMAKDVLEALLHKHAVRVESLQSNFTQTVSIPLLEEPLISKGRLVFVAPGSLRWEYLTPLEEGFILTPSLLIRWENGKNNRTNSTAGKDPLGAFLAQQLVTWVTFATDSTMKEYTIFLVTEAPLTLRLVPNSEQIKDILQQLEISFSPHGTASSVVLTEKNGGSTTLLFHDTTVNTPVSSAEFQ